MSVKIIQVAPRERRGKELSTKAYRTFTHLFTVLSHRKFNGEQNDQWSYFKSIEQSVKEWIKTYLNCTVIPPIFLPYSQSATYRSFTHRGTVLRNMKNAVGTVLWVTFLLANNLISPCFSECKVDQKYDYKRSSPRDVDFFTSIETTKRSSNVG